MEILWKEIFEFLSKFHWDFYLRVKLADDQRMVMACHWINDFDAVVQDFNSDQDFQSEASIPIVFFGFFFHIYKFYTKYPSEPDIDLHINHQQCPDHVDCCTVLASAWWLGTVSGVWDMAFPSRLVPACVQGPDSIYRYRLTSIGNPTVEIRRS